MKWEFCNLILLCVSRLLEFLQNGNRTNFTVHKLQKHSNHHPHLLRSFGANRHSTVYNVLLLAVGVSADRMLVGQISRNHPLPQKLNQSSTILVRCQSDLPYSAVNSTIDLLFINFYKIDADIGGTLDITQVKFGKQQTPQEI